jgi:hypothetical protein
MLGLKFCQNVKNKNKKNILLRYSSFFLKGKTSKENYFRKMKKNHHIRTLILIW